MRVVVISRTIQEFEGVRYYKCGNYFQRRGVRLHRVVWARKHGRKPPKGFHVHHHDENTSNNQPGNLILKPGKRHVSMHVRSQKRKMPVKTLEAARVWHSSKAGRAKHAEVQRANWKKRKAKRYICGECEKSFWSRAFQGATYCHLNCKMRAFNRRRRAAKGK